MPYHHGRLRDALVDAAMALARPGGPDAVVIRAVSRAAGVSHGAAYRHFADRADLLGEVCGRCMTLLAVLIESRIGELPATGDPVTQARARLDATGRAYIEFALTEPGWFRTAFAVPPDLDFQPGGGAGGSGLNPYQLLGAGLDALVEAGGLTPDRRPGAEYAAWSAVHGLSALLLDGPLRELPAAEREWAIGKVLEVVMRGL